MWFSAFARTTCSSKASFESNWLDLRGDPCTIANTGHEENEQNDETDPQVASLES